MTIEEALAIADAKTVSMDFLEAMWILADEVRRLRVVPRNDDFIQPVEDRIYRAEDRTWWRVVEGRWIPESAPHGWMETNSKSGKMKPATNP